jgi:hypothetical protein
VAAVAAGATLLVVYLATMARGVTFWDAGEFLAAVHGLGIPHPPGTPVFVLVAHTWAGILSPLVDFTIAVNALSAVTTAVGCALLGDLMERWTGDTLAAWSAAVCAGVTSTVWLNATETEVYASTFCLSIILLWTANRFAESKESRWLLLAAYLTGLAWALHLTALLTLPAAALLLLRVRPNVGAMCRAVPLLVLGASPILYLIIRAQHDPAIDQGNPATWSALWDVVQRHQYDVASPWPRRAPLWLQLGNVIEYADWQFARGLHSDPGPSWLRTPMTLVFALFGVVGSLAHRRARRQSWYVLLALFVVTTLGVALYLNLRVGPSYGYGILPANALREARERDYFFTWGFVTWGVWAGYGVVTWARRYGRPWIYVAAAVSLLPIATNYALVHYERSVEQQRAVRESLAMLQSVPANGVFVAYGDNDTYPLWYLQQVKGLRPDVTVVTVPLLGAPWARAEVQRRYALLDRDEVAHWRGFEEIAASIRRHAAAQGRRVIESPYSRRR